MELVSHRLKPSELVICRDAREITTVLGSCVAITMFNSRLGLAAMCHAMLPCPATDKRSGNTLSTPFKYLSEALPAMMVAFHRAGVSPSEIEVKMFGGGQVLGRRLEASNPQSIGPANIRMARELLQELQLTVKAANVGGNRGRKIVFNTETGEVFHKYLS